MNDCAISKSMSKSVFDTELAVLGIELVQGGEGYFLFQCEILEILKWDKYKGVDQCYERLCHLKENVKECLWHRTNGTGSRTSVGREELLWILSMEFKIEIVVNRDF